jgi:hypothetical protein
MGVAGLCAVHCMAAPWLVAALPWLGAAVASDPVETMFLCASLSVSGTTLVWSRWRVHSRWLAILVFAAGAGLLLGVRMGGAEEEPLGLIVSGASLLVLAHWLNSRCCAHAPCKVCEPRIAAVHR